ncbi:MAG: GNAT family N-acetyltransferase [Thermomicrobiales bacterium]
MTAAGPDDLPAIQAILHGAQAWLASRGIPQWPRPFPGEWIAARHAAGEFLVARHEGEIVAVVRVLQRDPQLWTDPAQDDALYVHSLAVARKCAGQGIGAALLAWIGEQAKREGRSRLRLDCVATNPALWAYYERLGFVSRGEIAAGGERMMLFEKPLTP